MAIADPEHIRHARVLAREKSRNRHCHKKEKRKRGGDAAERNRRDGRACGERKVRQRRNPENTTGPNAKPVSVRWIYEQHGPAAADCARSTTPAAHGRTELNRNGMLRQPSVAKREPSFRPRYPCDKISVGRIDIETRRHGRIDDEAHPFGTCVHTLRYLNEIPGQLIWVGVAFREPDVNRQSHRFLQMRSAAFLPHLVVV